MVSAKTLPGMAKARHTNTKNRKGCAAGDRMPLFYQEGLATPGRACGLMPNLATAERPAVNHDFWIDRDRLGPKAAVPAGLNGKTPDRWEQRIHRSRMENVQSFYRANGCPMHGQLAGLAVLLDSKMNLRISQGALGL